MCYHYDTIFERKFNDEQRINVQMNNVDGNFIDCVSRRLTSNEKLLFRRCFVDDVELDKMSEKKMSLFPTF